MYGAFAEVRSDTRRIESMGEIREKRSSGFGVGTWTYWKCDDTGGGVCSLTSLTRWLGF